MPAPFRGRPHVGQVREERLPGTDVRGLLPFQVGQEDDLHRLAARCAFWKMPRAAVVPFAKHLGIDLDGCTSLCATLFKMIKAILKLDEEEKVYEILSVRLSFDDSDNKNTIALLEMDEAKDVLDREDQRQIETEQKDAKKAAVEHCAFAGDFRKRRHQNLLDLAAKAKGKAKAKANAKPLAKKVLPLTISQKEAKEYLPPAPASIWLSNQREAWCAHIRPYTRISTPFAQYSSSELALWDLLCKAWAQHFARSGMTKADCIFDYDATLQKLEEQALPGGA